MWSTRACTYSSPTATSSLTSAWSTSSAAGREVMTLASMLLSRPSCTHCMSKRSNGGMLDTARVRSMGERPNVMMESDRVRERVAPNVRQKHCSDCRSGGRACATSLS
ncbi:hypothetical protein AMAG_19411 [Allomyces macrogynus ATCC 38327]|uniref:Uncharacterized protein n=1 Tax=Allomyces macrogynus (strain ATCC 38327) TaxID=578462 RepID=A0A0L0SR72_ALLM3|nr:hypothetical protein AMAG_19411 [Allomyces macrogynus ATCC 38327]|eukprot:KNE65012.1 hypothetical protein AMAG_19411 [Allomyces macrogynus ATCC 38327]